MESSHDRSRWVVAALHRDTMAVRSVAHSVYVACRSSEVNPVVGDTLCTYRLPHH